MTYEVRNRTSASLRESGVTKDESAFSSSRAAEQKLKRPSL